MFKLQLSALALAGISFVSVSTSSGAGYAATAINYVAGGGTTPGFVNSVSALGPLTTNATPFNPPALNSQLVSIGTNGSLTVKFAAPIVNHPAHPYGADFSIYGNSSFFLTNDTRTDGQLLRGIFGGTVVSVSRDNVTYYKLNPALAPAVGGYYPTDSAGDFGVPVNPALVAADFAGQDLAGIRALYQGSAGGAGYNISWAQDPGGNAVFLTDIQYVRLDAVGSNALIDGFATVDAPAKPGAVTFTENFTNNPAANGWRSFGTTNLFHWDATKHELDVTWDSSKSNSYYYHPLGTVLTKEDDFSAAFNLYLTNYTIGATPGKPSNFQIALGFFNLADATNSGFLRAVYPFTIRNLVEFDFFPPDPANGTDGSTGPTVFFANQDFVFDGGTYHLTMTSNDVFEVRMNYTASNHTLVTLMTRDGQPFGPVNSAAMPDGADDFRLDQFAVMSYSDAGQTGIPQYFGSILAQGRLGNVVLTTPPPPVQKVTGGLSNSVWTAQFISQTNWLYTLERTADFQAWSPTSAATPGNGGNLTLQDNQVQAGSAYYRVRANRP